MNLTTDGVIVLRNVYSKQQISKYRTRYEQLRNKVFQHLPKLGFKDGIGWFKQTEVLKLAPGRFDFWYGMDKGMFAKPAFLRPRRIKCALDTLDEFVSYAGALPSVGKSKNGHWHRDVYNIFDEAKLIGLPPFYYTMLIPLVDITEENGPTEYLLGSHRLKRNQLRRCDRVRLTMNVGDVVLANGMTFHRGTANHTGSDRSMLYVVSHRKWYSDYTPDARFQKQEAKDSRTLERNIA